MSRFVPAEPAVSTPRRSPLVIALALAFSIVIVLIAALDRPESGIMTVTQQPLADVRAVMSAVPKSP